MTVGCRGGPTKHPSQSILAKKWAVRRKLQRPPIPLTMRRRPQYSDVEIVVRPQHLDIHEDEGSAPPTTPECGAHARGEVIRSRFVGAQSLIEVRMDHSSEVLRATVPYAYLPKPGTTMWLGLRRDRCFVFPCATQSKVASPFAAE